jgi:hypothetical protein
MFVLVPHRFSNRDKALSGDQWGLFARHLATPKSSPEDIGNARASYDVSLLWGGEH